MPGLRRLLALSLLVVPIPSIHAADTVAERQDPGPLVVDRKVRAKIELAREAKTLNKMDDALRLLQEVLDSQDESFIPIQEEREGKTITRFVPARVEAERLLAELPRDERFEELFESKARELLTAAKEKNDLAMMLEVVRRFPTAKTEAEALQELAARHFDAGELENSALYFQRLYPRRAAVQWDLPMIFRESVAFRYLGSNELADKYWKRLAAAIGNNTLAFGDRVLTFAEASEEAKKLLAKKPVATPGAWPVHGGSPSRSFLADLTTVSEPFLGWARPVVSAPESMQLLKDEEKTAHKFNHAILPGTFPITTTIDIGGSKRDLVIYCSWYGIHAVDLATDEQVWDTDARFAPDRLMQIHPTDWLQVAGQALGGRSAKSDHALVENTLVGTMSADANGLYVIEDFYLPTSITTGAALQLDKRGEFARGNRLCRYGLRTGKLTAVYGGLEDPKATAPQTLHGRFFLGAPLPLGDRLYVLTEKNHEIELVCLDPARDPQEADPVCWKVLLCDAHPGLAFDAVRHSQAAQISAAEDLLICQTNAGAVVAVDRITHRIQWAHTYTRGTQPRTAKDRNAAPARAGWHGSVPIISGARVLLLPADGDLLACVDLHTGARLWQLPRAPEDLYVAGAFGERVLVVSQGAIAAYWLENGKAAWGPVPTGDVSGHGVGAGNTYYLPLRSTADSVQPVVWAIDISEGEVARTSKWATSPSNSRGQNSPGNLILFHGMTLSQTSWSISAAPCADAHLAKLAQRLKENPKDGVALYFRGALLLESGDSRSAVADLREALRQDPPARIADRARAALHQALADLLSADFAANLERLKEFHDTCKVEDAKLTDGQRQAEEQSRLQTYFMVLARGKQAQGRLDDALDAYLQLLALNKYGDMMSLPDVDESQVAPARWLRGRVADLLQNGDDAERHKLEQHLLQQWEKTKAAGDAARLRSFADLLDPGTHLGAEIRLQLVEWLLAFQDAPLAEIETLLLEVPQSEAFAGRVLESLARAELRKGSVADAAYHYRLLGRDHAKAVLRDGKTGADLLREARSEPRLALLLGEESPAWTARLRGTSERGDFHLEKPILPLVAPPSSMPSMNRLRLQLDPASGELLLVDPDAKPIAVTLKVPVAAPLMFHMLVTRNNTCIQVPSGGHVLVISTGTSIVAIDPVARRQLWEYALQDDPIRPRAPIRSIDPAPDGTFFVTFENGWLHRLDDNVLVQPGFVCCLAESGLVALDLLNGKVLWSRSEIAPGSALFGDTAHVFVIERAEPGQSARTLCFRIADGARVQVPDFEEAYHKCVRRLGRRLLMHSSTDAEERLALHDPLTGVEIWRQAFAKGAVLLHTEDAALTGMVDREGKVIALGTADGKQIFAGELDPQHLDDIANVHLLMDRELVYLMIQRKPPKNFPDAAPNFPWEIGLRWLPVNGEIYAFERDTSKLRWRFEAPQAVLILQDFQDVPFLMMSSRYQLPLAKSAVARFPQDLSQVRIIEKKTGKRIFDDKDIPHAPYFHTLTVDPVKQRVEFINDMRKVILEPGQK